MEGSTNADAEPLQGTKLNPQLTLSLAQASLAAYYDYQNMPFTAPANYAFVGRFTGWDGLFGPFGQEERFGLVFKYIGPSMIANRFIVAFRGTDSDWDVFEDSFFSDTAVFQPYRNSASPTADDVCSGFDSIYSSTGDGSMSASMQQQIFSMLPEQPSEVLITGHSLGAALSQLFTLDMRVSSPGVKIANINFASPMVGGADWQAACDNAGVTSRVTRVINYFDYVPDYPLGILGYVPIGAEFRTAFYGSDDPVLDEGARHSLLNLQTVLSHCLWLKDQIWVGTFWDAQDPTYQMWTVAPPEMLKDELLAKLLELRELERRLRAARSRATPLILANPATI